MSYLAQNYNSSYGTYTSVPVRNYNQEPNLMDRVSYWFNSLTIISGMVSAIFITIGVYAVRRMKTIQKHEKDHVDHAIHEYEHALLEKKRNPRFEIIENLMLAQNEADWRVAIIEADVLLEEALISTGTTGSGVGEMLTNMGPKSFATYEYAWQAHKVRNDIAHEGIAYKLNREDAIKTINLYRAVLQEFGKV